ncbi:hypothetical protein ASG65_17820 [Bacillus sp. Leaf13]|nr:hypothetical protein ASG65_17820 [Bacillus sp. Leaf13]
MNSKDRIILPGFTWACIKTEYIKQKRLLLIFLFPIIRNMIYKIVSSFNEGSKRFESFNKAIETIIGEIEIY